MNRKSASTKKKEEQKRVENLNIEIELCQNCESHAHIVRHQSTKYQYFYDQIKRKFNSYKIGVRKRQKIAQSTQNLLIPGQRANNTTQKKIEQREQTFFPRIGAFEVYFKDQLIFSKLESETWPNPEDLLKKVIFIIEYEKQKTKPEKSLKLKRSIQADQAVNSQSKKHYYHNYYLSKNVLLSNQARVPRRYIHSVQRQKIISLEDKSQKAFDSLNPDTARAKFERTIPRQVKSQSANRWDRFNRLQFSQRQKRSVENQQKKVRYQLQQFTKTNKESQEVNRIHYHDYKKRLAEKLKKLQQLNKGEKQYGIQVFDVPLEAINQSPKQIIPKQIKMADRHFAKHKKRINAKINSIDLS